MPRRKQGQIKESTGINQRKKSDTGNKLLHTAVPKKLPTKNDLVFKIKKTLSSTTFSSTPNGKAQREHIEAAKSLNENTLVSQQEVNNNSISLSEIQKSNMISKSDINCFISNDVNESAIDDDTMVTEDSGIIMSPLKDGVLSCSSSITESSMSKFKLKTKNDYKIDSACENSVITSTKESIIKQIPNSMEISVISIGNLKTSQAQKESTDCQLTVENCSIMVANSEMCCDSSLEKQDIDRGSNEMSGVSPASPSARNNTESHVFNYRLSTSINVTKASPSNPSVLNEQICELPSSVYGTPASNIEKVLNGLSIPGKNSDSALVGKISFLQEILEKDASEKVSYHEHNIKKEHKNLDQALQDQNELFNDSKSLPVENVKMIFKSDSNKNNCSEDLIQPKLKLHIPDALNADDSSSSAISSESQKVIKFPKITSPQILEQHISKIISENAAIIDTFDPLWPRRYLKNSQSLDSDSKKQGNIFKLTHTNLEISNQSKLQSALLGGSEKESQNLSQSAINSSNLDSGSTLSKSQTFSHFNNSSINKTVNVVSEEELQGSAIKSLLSLKQGRYSKQKKAFCFEKKDIYDQHPQNPEGSIIKDLLLKTKANESQKLSPEKESNIKTNVHACSFLPEPNLRSTISSSSPLKCPHCGSEFYDKYNLDTHVSLCKNIDSSLFSFGDSSKKAFSMPKANAQMKSDVAEYQKSCFSSLVSKDVAQIEDKVSVDDGPILKKQLLLPLSSCPPMKRRKISEPVLTSNQIMEQKFNKEFKKTISPKVNFEGSSMAPYRSRSQSVHLFGGEVQILDGIKSKKMRIKTRIQGAFSPERYNYPFHKSPDSDHEKDSNSFPAVTVTIAQPVHNSGGTVTHVPSRKHSSNLTSIVTISDSNIISESLIKYGKTEMDCSNSYRSSTELEPTKNLVSHIQFKELPSSKSLSSYPYLPGSESKCIISPSQNVNLSIEKDLKVNSLKNDGSPLSFKLAPSPEHSNPFYSPIFTKSEKHGFDVSAINTLPELKKSNEIISLSPHVVPTVLLTPSSPTVPSTENDSPSYSSSVSEPTKKFLAPMRPTSLPLKKKPFTMVGSTLISPETPRPKKTCVQMYLNGHAYTYLGLKCSTRSTYCCIYRPQPMFVPQETNPKLSMYSNWQVVPAKEELCGLTPGQVISHYSSKQKKEPSCTTDAKMGEPLTFTHSSYWTFRSQEKDASECQEKCISPKAIRDVIQDSVFHLDQETTLSGVTSQQGGTFIATTTSSENQVHSADDSSHRLDTDNTLSDDLDVNASNDEDEDDDDDCQDDGTESLTDSSQPLPPKRVKIFEGGFKSNEDYTYVRGRGRGKYVCEECGIRCKKPSMLKKHIRTHTDLRPYKCRHCSFAFKTKGNLTKHMKSKAHHKKCTELGIVPVPTTTDDSQIDEEALAKQIEKKKTQFSDGEDADDDEDDTDESDDDECDSDTSMMASTPKPKTLANGHTKKSCSNEKTSETLDASFQERYESTSQQMVEQEAARSLLHLSALGEPSQWSTSTGDLTDVASCETDTGSLLSNRHEQTLPQYSSQTVSTIVLPGNSSKFSSDQATLSWIPTETLGHRPRSYSADIPSSGGKELLARYRLAKNINVEASGNASVEDSEFESREPYTRRYSISVAREARKPRILHPPEWDRAGILDSKWPDLDSSDQPMDLSISRDLGRNRVMYRHEILGSSLLSAVTQEEAGLDGSLPIHLNTGISEPYSLKSLPVLSPQILTEYETAPENSNTDTTLLQHAEESAFSSSSQNRSVFYMPNITEGSVNRKEADITDDPPSPDMSDYAVCSPVSPPALEDGSYYYGQEGLGQSTNTSEEMPPTSRFHAEFIVPSTSSGMEDGKCVCRICNKIFAKSSHLRLHVNIHYFERPFRCDNCAVSFRTKGHLQKHKRSVSHYNKVNMNLTFGTPTVDNPRPFKCADCKIAFRIHGHLAKHLRSKMHIMKLECLGKLPFGMYAEMERSGVSLNEIDTTDCNNSLESLQVMAQKLYQRDPRRMRWQGPEHIASEVEQSKSAATAVPVIESTLSAAEPLAVTFNLPCSVVGLPPQPGSISKTATDSEDVKKEPSEMEAFRRTSAQDQEGTVSPVSQYLITTQPQPPPSKEALRKIDGPEHESAISLHRSGTCHICGRLFKSAKFLQVHLYCDHPTWNPSSANEAASSNTSASAAASVPDLACDLCGKCFPNQKGLQQHLLSHAQPRPFVCEICDAGFTSSASLIAHKSTHQNTSSAATESRLVQLR